MKPRFRLLLARNLLPSTATSSPPNSSSSRHSATNCLHTAVRGWGLWARKSAIVLKSGVSLCNSHITSTLRFASLSKRRLDRTRFR